MVVAEAKMATVATKATTTPLILIFGKRGRSQRPFEPGRCCRPRRHPGHLRTALPQPLLAEEAREDVGLVDLRQALAVALDIVAAIERSIPSLAAGAGDVGSGARA